MPIDARMLTMVVLFEGADSRAGGDDSIAV